MHENMSDEQRQVAYDEIMERAQKAQVARCKHYCPRKAFVEYEWFNEGLKASKFSVWDDTPDDGGDTQLVFESNDENECRAFIQQGAQRCRLEKNDLCLVCDMYEKRRAAVKQGKQPSFLVVVYGISRHYLGPEEGGIYGDATEVLEVGRAYTWQGGLKLAREFREQYPTQRYGRGSVLGNGQDTYVRAVYAEADPRMPEDYFPSRTYQ